MNNNWIYRKQLLLEYGALATTKNEIPLRDFQSGADEASRAIGRSKTILVFHLLRRMAGEEAYSRLSGTNMVEDPVRSWDEIKERFEKELGQDLGWFFKQWVDRKGLPDLRVENASIQQNGSRFKISFDLVQKGEVYTLDIPIVISFIHGKDRAERVKLEADKKEVVLFVDEEPSAVVIDPEYDVPRRLTDAETPPLLAKLLSEEKPVLVTAVTGRDVYAGAVAAWKQRGAEERQTDTIKDADVNGSSFLAFGPDNPLVGRLYGRVETGNGELSLVAKKNPWNPDKVVVIVQARTEQAASEALSAVLLHGICSALSIDAKGQVAQKTLESEQGIVMELREEATAIDVSALKTISNVIEGVSRKKIVYVGEYHDRFAHHNVELQIIKGLFQKDPKIAVGMEMFQRPFQKTLDEYVSGSIDEREFLKKSEYFKRWGFDYNLYKPILDYARAEKIPVVALNLSREITDKVAKTGMDSLTNDERKDVPEQMDFSDLEYRDRLRQVFDQHAAASERNFDFFLQAQILWDEGMALAHRRLPPEERGPADGRDGGRGTPCLRFGGPERTFRRNGLPYATVLSDVAIEADIADFVVFPSSLDGMTSPKIMAVLKESGNRSASRSCRKGVSQRRPASRSAIFVVSLDNTFIRSVDDIRIALFYKKSEDRGRIKVVRKRFLPGYAEIEFDVKLK